MIVRISTKTKRTIKVLRIMIGLVVLYCIGYMFLRYEYISLAEKDISMTPAIPGGKRIIVDTFAGSDEDPYEVGQIVLYKAQWSNRQILRLGRIVGGPGESITRKENLLWVEDRDLRAVPGSMLLADHSLEEESYLILVENPLLRAAPDPGFPDSRSLGPIHADKIVGRYIIHF